MPISDQKLRAELNNMEKLDKSGDPLDPMNCPMCRSGVMPYPPEIMADVVNVEL